MSTGAKLRNRETACIASFASRGEDDHTSALLYVRQGRGQQVGAVSQPASSRLQRERCVERARSEAFLLSANASVSRGPDRTFVGV